MDSKYGRRRSESISITAPFQSSVVSTETASPVISLNSWLHPHRIQLILIDVIPDDVTLTSSRLQFLVSLSVYVHLRQTIQLLHSRDSEICMYRCHSFCGMGSISFRLFVTILQFRPFPDFRYRGLSSVVIRVFDR